MEPFNHYLIATPVEGYLQGLYDVIEYGALGSPLGGWNDLTVGQGYDLSRQRELSITWEESPVEWVDGTRLCLDCGCEFSSFAGDQQLYCGNCSTTRHLPRCGHRTIHLVGMGLLTCKRPYGHTGTHAYGRRRS